MGYAAAIKAFLINSRYFFIAAALVFAVWYIRHQGVVAEREKWQVSTEKLIKKTQEQLTDLNLKAMKEQTKSEQLANQLQAQFDDSDRQRNESDRRINDLLSRRMQSRQICRRDSTIAKTRDIHTTPVNESTAKFDGFTKEFGDFLNSSFRRGEEAGIYAKVAHEFIEELCARDDIKCIVK